MHAISSALSILHWFRSSLRAAPRHPANASRPAKKFRVPLTVPELVKQKIAGPRASGVGSDFVIDDGTGKTLGMVVGVTE
ncbi:TPA: hypothetical protein ACGH35_004736 [Salmonella enterica subsp. enterica serovar Saintpaul]|nr:hypothetical protein [Escherichia coli]